MYFLDYVVLNFNGFEEYFWGMLIYLLCDFGEKCDRWNSIFIKINWLYEYVII